jgi:hypothetical protein
MWYAFAEASRDAVRQELKLLDHPIWSSRPYSRFIFDPVRLIEVVDYINGNPPKHGLPAQSWSFVKGDVYRK